MGGPLDPQPTGDKRAELSRRVRELANNLARNRAPRLAQTPNDDLEKALSASGEHIAAFGTFTKGLIHDRFGRVQRSDLLTWIAKLSQAPREGFDDPAFPFAGVDASGMPAPFNVKLYDPNFDGPYYHATPNGARGWDSPLSGHTFDLVGEDADGVGLPPAPPVGSSELTAEMAELYVAALLRDVPFSDWSDGRFAELCKQLQALPFFDSEDGLDAAAKRRRDARMPDGALDPNTLLRGSTAGAKRGPYVSQFLLIGNQERQDPDDPTTARRGVGTKPWPQEFDPRPVRADDDAGLTRNDGVILYGLQSISQKIRGHLDGVDHLTAWSLWHDVQNAADRSNVFDRFNPVPRFITTPRDLASYTHFDEPQQAYTNAALILSSMGAMTDLGLPEGADQTRGASTTFSTPHLTALINEVTYCALKAAQRQGGQIHLRSRPETVAAGLSMAWTGGRSADALGPFKSKFAGMVSDLGAIIARICDHNKAQNERAGVSGDHPDAPIGSDTNALLPLAYAEGSPMSAAYGAAHAAVAGAAVTVLKAFFEMFETRGAARSRVELYEIAYRHTGYPGVFPKDLFGFEKRLTGDRNWPRPSVDGEPDYPKPFEADPQKPGQLREVEESPDLTIQGELDKLAANMAFGRTFAGVNYYSDYHETLRLGERIAVSILQERMLTFREPVSMRFTSFDGDYIMVAGTGAVASTDDALVFVWDEIGRGGTPRDFANWYNRHRRSDTAQTGVGDEFFGFPRLAYDTNLHANPPAALGRTGKD